MNSVPEHEIVIIRRGGHGHEEGHHGGVWKIAFADFMTAMMAFFLVLWIVNSSSKETRASVARYFNPVKLSDTTPARKGLQTAKELDFDAAAGEAGTIARTDEGCGDGVKSPKPAHAESGHDAPKKGKPSECARPETGNAPLFPEESLLTQPQAVLSEIVASGHRDEARRDKAGTDRTDTVARSEDQVRNRLKADLNVANAKPGLAADPVFSDPFEPVSPILATRRAADGRAILKADPLGPVEEHAAGPEQQSPSPHQPLIVETVAPLPNTAQPAISRAKSAEQSGLAKEEAIRLAEDLTEALKGDALKGDGPRIEIKAVPEGTLISLTDALRFGMFAIGSAEPQPRTIALMARIASVLKQHKGALVIRGHTDGRQYPNARYDNWHLSADRAQMSYQMLLRGGLDPKRLDRIEGHADRMPKIAGDPGAAENRRIEILLKTSAP